MLHDVPIEKVGFCHSTCCMYTYTHVPGNSNVAAASFQNLKKSGTK